MATVPTSLAPQAIPLSGLVIGCAAFVCWGLYPFYFRLLGSVGAVEIIAHRILWSFVVLVPIVLATGRLGEVWAALRQRRTCLGLMLSSALIIVNWTVYVGAVLNDCVLDASLGYFLCPLMSVGLGVVVFKERLGRWQWGSVALAAAAVAMLVVRLGVIPVVALSLALLFAVYGAVRKHLPIGPAPGLLAECLLSLPVALGILGWHMARGDLAFATGGLWLQGLLAAGGIATVGPLLLWNIGAKRLPYSTIGLLQYIAPTMLFLEGVLIFGEPLEPARLAAFTLIWAALVIYAADVVLRARRAMA